MVNIKATALLALPLLAYAAPLLNSGSTQQNTDVQILQNEDVDVLEGLVARSEDFDEQELFARAEHEEEDVESVVVRAKAADQQDEETPAGLERRQRFIPPGVSKTIGQTLGKVIFKGHNKADKATSGGGGPPPPPKEESKGFNPKGSTVSNGIGRLFGLKGSK